MTTKYSKNCLTKSKMSPVLHCWAYFLLL